MSQADAEHGHRAEEPSHGLGLLSQWLGVAGAVREDDAVEALELVGLGRVREDGHSGTCLREPAQDRAFRPVVDERNFGRAFGEDVRLAGRDLCDERLALHRRLRSNGVQRVLDRELVLVGDRHRPHRPASRSRRTSERVSISARATRPCSASQSAHSEPPSFRISTASACARSTRGARPRRRSFRSSAR